MDDRACTDGLIVCGSTMGSRDALSDAITPNSSDTHVSAIGFPSTAPQLAEFKTAQEAQRAAVTAAAAAAIALAASMSMGALCPRPIYPLPATRPTKCVLHTARTRTNHVTYIHTDPCILCAGVSTAISTAISSAGSAAGSSAGAGLASASAPAGLLSFAGSMQAFVVAGSECGM